MPPKYEQLIMRQRTFWNINNKVLDLLKPFICLGAFT